MSSAKAVAAGILLVMNHMTRGLVMLQFYMNAISPVRCFIILWRNQNTSALPRSKYLKLTLLVNLTSGEAIQFTWVAPDVDWKISRSSENHEVNLLRQLLYTGWHRTNRLTQTANTVAFWTIGRLTKFWAFQATFPINPPLVSSPSVNEIVDSQWFNFVLPSFSWHLHSVVFLWSPWSLYFSL